ncbi:gypsy type transposase, partial [Tanacetum coccineum]
NDPNLFSIKVNHGGGFSYVYGPKRTRAPRRVYKGGNADWLIMLIVRWVLYRCEVSVDGLDNDNVDGLESSNAGLGTHENEALDNDNGQSSEHISSPLRDAEGSDDNEDGYENEVSSDENGLLRILYPVAERKKALSKLRKCHKPVDGHIYTENFYVSQTFPNKEIIKDMVTRISVKKKRELHLVKNDQTRVRAECRGLIPVFGPTTDIDPNVEGPTDGLLQMVILTVLATNVSVMAYSECLGQPSAAIAIIEEGQVTLLDSIVSCVIPLAGENDQARKIDKRKKRRVAGGASGSNHPLKKLREDHDTFGNVTASTGGKSLAVIQNLFKRGTLNVNVGVRAVTTVPFVTSSVTPTLEHEGGGLFLIIIAYVADAEVASLVRSSISPPPVMTAAVTTAVIAGVSSAPLYGMDYDQLFAEFNVGAAHQTCLGAEIRMHAEIANLKAQLSLREAEAAEAIRLCNQVSVVEAEVAARVSELNSLKEWNIVLEKEKNALEGQVVALESVAATKDTELISLNAQMAKLTQDLSSLQLSCDELIHDEQVKELSNRVVGLDSELMALALHLDDELYHRILTTIAGQRAVIGLAIDKGIQAGLVAGIDHGKAERNLADVASYDPSVEARYVSPVLAFRDLDFNLLHKLESQKDASIADIMNSLCWRALLEGLKKEDNVVVRETPLSDSLNMVHDHIQHLKESALSHRLSISDAIGTSFDPLSSKKLLGEASTSRVPATADATTALSISVTATNVISIPPISVADYNVPNAEIQDEAPHSPKIVFEKETLETTPEHPSVI